MCFSICCTRIEKDVIKNNEQTELFHDEPDCESISAVLKRAGNMVNIKWMPINPVPNILGTYYPKGRLIVGLPYSSGQELCTFVGQDVSFYTFLSAVNNPYSYLYTQDLSLPPYKGTLCRPYYGTVCSAAVDYALGLRIQYTTYMYKGLPFFQVVTDSFIESLHLCDLLLEEGHVGMIYDIIRDNYGKVRHVSVFESIHEGTKITEYTRSQFISRWKKVGWELLRYTKIRDNAIECDNDPQVLEDGFEFNPCLSTAKGDCVSYAERDSVIINIFDKSQGNLMVMKDQSIYSSIPISHDVQILYNLPCGDYEVYIQREDSSISPSIFFDIVNTEATIEVKEEVTVHFTNNHSVPIYLVFCQLSHRYLSFHEITPEDVSKGYISVKPEITKTYYYKVLFQGKYGRVASDLKRVK